MLERFDNRRCRVLVEMLATDKRQVYPPCCGSADMCMRSEEFVEEHGGCGCLATSRSPSVRIFRLSATDFCEEAIIPMTHSDCKQKLKTKWAAVEAFVGSEKRIRLIVEDSFQHFEW